MNIEKIVYMHDMVRMYKDTIIKMVESDKFSWCFHEHYDHPMWSVWRKFDETNNSMYIEIRNGKFRAVHESAERTQMYTDIINSLMEDKYEKHKNDYGLGQTI